MEQRAGPIGGTAKGGLARGAVDPGFGPTRDHQRHAGVPSLPPIRNHPRTRPSLHHGRGVRPRLALTSGQPQAQQIAQPINSAMDGRAEATATASQHLRILRAVVFPHGSTRMGTSNRTCPSVFHIAVVSNMHAHPLPDTLSHHRTNRV
jgi:hypothetical protein